MIMDAKTDDTRKRRLQQSMSLLEQAGASPTIFHDSSNRADGEREGLDEFPKPRAVVSPALRGWIMHARKEETRVRRLREAVKLLAQNKKLGLK